MASWHPDNVDEHESGQLRLTVAGEQVPLLPLPDSAIPTSDEPQAESNPDVVEWARAEALLS